MSAIKLPWEREGNHCDDESLIEFGRSIIECEAEELIKAGRRMGNEYVIAARAIYECEGRLIVVGVGKPGLIGRKIAATFASLGTPSFFLHAGEALHGDLGMACREDIALILSNSGASNEIVGILPYFKRIGSVVIAITGSPDSPLAQSADIVLDSHVEREADTLNLAPTTSTTLQLVIGDVLAGMVTKLRGIKSEDFALFHPGGALGKRLLTHVSEVMYKGDRLPSVSEGSNVREALFEMTKKGFGATCVVNDSGELIGIFTDGDLRRLLEKSGSSAIDGVVTEAMTRNPITITPNKLAAEAAHIMEQREITVLIVTDGDEPAHKKTPLGIVQLHDLYIKGESPLRGK
ncbi:MAG: KpsF/GutQ family sugar-phosphate isomerase [Synergistaceae bacterium]|nr:KpsF/GutQ family sugar-phosphate isomerase [Synergistaceae bacterium]